MDPLLLSRIQFALTIGFHYIFPPLSIGLSLVIVAFEALYLRTREKRYLDASRFWVGLFALTFAVGVASGIVMEFEFGTNWAAYSRFVGDVFGSPLAAEGVFAFFLESTFLGVLLFGWKRVGPRTHFASSVLVSLGAHLSAFWIVVANSWMQTPAGFHVVTRDGFTRAEIVDFWAMVFNPSSLPRYTHVILGCWMAGAFVATGVAALYLLQRRHAEFARSSLKIGLLLAALSSTGQLLSGHWHAVQVAATQPAKLAAFEAHYPESAPGDLYLFGWVDERNEAVWGVKLPGMLSWLVSFDASRPLPGLRSFPPGDRPPVQLVFQTYHLMVGLGMAMIGLSWIGLFLWWRGRLFDFRPYLVALVPALLFPQAANQLGWISAEVGRQPWIVYNLLRTSEALSKTVSGGEVLLSLLLFGAIYSLLFLLFAYLAVHKVMKGPAPSGKGA
jgi:cytochrome d ubiquinol oxidase subunit I